MPDGYDKRPSPGDRPPARRTTPRGQVPEPVHDGYDEDDRRRGRPGRRIAEWLGFAREDVYDDERTDPGDDYDPPPRTSGSGSGGGRDDDFYDQERDEPPRRRSPWDIMLGAPAPGTPMTDAVPRDTMPPDGAAGPEPQRERRAGAAPPRARRTSDPVSRRYASAPPVEPAEAPDPMDPVDPLDPRDPGGDAETPSRPAAPPPAAPLPPPTLPARPATPAPSPSAAPSVTVPPVTVPPAAVPPDTPTALHPLVVPAPRAGDGEDDPAPRRMLRMMPSPVLADGGGLVADGGRVGRTTVRTAGLRGELHQQQGIARQNCFAVGPDRERRWTIAILADGVASTYAAELAAQIAVRSTYRAVARMVTGERHENWDWERLGSDLDAELADRLREIGRRGAEQGRTPPATRLAILVTAANPMEDDRVDMAVIGDSTVLRLAKGGWRAPLGLRDSAADAAPPALPDHGDGGTAELRVCRTTWRPTDALVMMTGGFADALGDPVAGLAPRLAERWRTPPEPLAFLGDVAEGLGSRTEDAAVVALWPQI